MSPYLVVCVAIPRRLDGSPKMLLPFDIVGSSFQTDVGASWATFIIPLVAVAGYVYLNQLTFVDAYQLASGFEFDAFTLGVVLSEDFPLLFRL